MIPSSSYKCEIIKRFYVNRSVPASVLYEMDEYQEMPEIHSVKHCLTYTKLRSTTYSCIRYRNTSLISLPNS